jgi:hypothetical protein
MNLSRHASVLWRFRRVTAAGVVIGIVLAILASYRVSSKGLEPRGSETWSAVSSILVTQAGFPEARVTLPEKQIDTGVTSDGQDAVQENSSPSDQLEFADPARLAYQADLYSKFLISDDVLRRVPEHPMPAQVMASPFASAMGGQVLPVIQLTTMGESAAKAQTINLHVFKALNEFIDEGARQNDLPKAKRIELRILNSPEVTLMSGRKPTMSVLAFMLVMLMTVAVTHLLEALRNRRQTEAALATIVDWDAPTPNAENHRSNGRAAEPAAELAGRRNR